jgi:hypothetical protein
MWLVIFVVTVAGVLRIRALRVRVLDGLDELAGRFQAELGPMTPAQLVKRGVKAAERGATNTPTCLVFPNVIDIGVAARDKKSWGPLSDNLPSQVIEAMAARAEDADLAFAGNAAPRVSIHEDPLARSHRPRIKTSLERVAAPSTPNPGNGSAGGRTPPMRRTAQRNGHSGRSTTYSGRPTAYSPADHSTAVRGLDSEPTRRVCVLLFEDRGRAVLEVHCQEGTHCGGRHKRCDIRLDNETVSDFHFEVHVFRDEVRIRDLDSTNGTRVNGKSAKAPIALHDGDIVQLSGEVTMRVLRGSERRKAA